jgi:hypothetical protein
MVRRVLPVRRGGRTSYAEFKVINPGKGLNTLISDNLIDDREASDLENIQFVEAGSPTKASGFSRVGNILDNKPRGLGFYNNVSGGSKYVLTVDGANLKYLLNTAVWTIISGAAFDTTRPITFTQARNKMYVWDSVNGGAELSGLTLSRPGTMPRAGFSIYYASYHCASGVDTQPNRLYISKVDDSSAFTNGATTLNNNTEVPGATVFTGSGANFVDIAKDDGDKITALGKFQDALVVFKERSIYQVTFDNTGTPIVAAVTKSYGCVSHRSVDNSDNDLIFLSRNGHYILGNEPNYFNVIRTNELSARIHPTIETISATNLGLAAGIFYKYVYYCGVPAGGTPVNNSTLTYDRRFGAFSMWTHVQPEAFVVAIDSNNVEHLYFTAANAQKIYELDNSLSADGAPITASFTTKAYDLGDLDRYKRWIDATLYLRQLVGSLNIDIITDNGVVEQNFYIPGSATRGGFGRFMFGEPMMGGDVEGTDSAAVSTSTLGSNIPYRMKLSIKSRTIKLRFSNDNANENFRVLGWKFAYRDYSHFTFPSSLKVGGAQVSEDTTFILGNDDGTGLEVD